MSGLPPSVNAVVVEELKVKHAIFKPLAAVPMFWFVGRFVPNPVKII